MLFKQHVLDGIARGEVVLAFRRWKRPTVVPGGRLRTSAGEVRFGEVRAIAEDALTEDDARKAGFASLAALKQDLRGGEDRRLFRIEIRGLDEDARAALQADGEIDEDAATELAARLARWDRINGIAGYHVRLLEAIAGKPAVPAAQVAAALGIEKLKFKRDARKLKELGLVTSLAVGYRLSPRGNAFLAAGRAPSQASRPEGSVAV